MYDVLSIRRANPIDAVLTEAGVELQSLGRRLVGRCPLHGDGQPSLVVYPDSQSYFCFGCGAGGDVIDFVSRLREVGFKEAASVLASSGRQPAVPLRSLPSATPPTSSVKLTRREAGWWWRVWISGVGAVVTGIVMVTIAATKFVHGAWIVVLLIPTLAAVFIVVHRHYEDVAHQLSLEEVDRLSPNISSDSAS